MCLAQGHNAMTTMRLESAALRSRVKHSTTEPLPSLAYHQFSANDFSMSLIEHKTYSSIERRFSVHSPILFFCYGLTCSKYKPGQAISACVLHKILDDLTQKPTKLIRTELVKMTSEASLLPTDLKNIHQTVYRSRRKNVS